MTVPHMNDKPSVAFSLVKLLGVLAIVALLAAIVVPRLGDSNERSQIAACEAHKGNIEIQAELWLHETGAWPASDLAVIGADPNHFPEGLPVCPVDGAAYTIDPATGRVSGHSH